METLVAAVFSNWLISRRVEILFIISAGVCARFLLRFPLTTWPLINSMRLLSNCSVSFLTRCNSIAIRINSFESV